MAHAPIATPPIKIVPKEPGAERSYYSVSQVAALLGVSRVSVWRWICSGRLPVQRLGHRTVRVSREDLQLLVRPARHAGVETLPTAADLGTAAHPQAGDNSGHLVLFYEAEHFLLDGVVDYIAPALRSGEFGVVVATSVHREGIEERLEAAGVDVRCARLDGRYLAVDATETLSRFMQGRSPDPTLFEEVASNLIGRAGPGRQVRVFGEMVALLVADGNPVAALELEVLWNGLQNKLPFSLLCGYPMEQFGGEALVPVFVDACKEHSFVVPTESYSGLDNRQARLREVAALQQKAASLEIEVAERRRAEDQLRLALAAERAARDEAEAALRVREEFLSIASHELRTPITVLGAQAQLSLRRLARAGELDPERVSQALKTMGNQADKLARLVSQLLDISRLDGGKLRLEPRPTDLRQLVDQVVSTVSSLTGQHTISVTAPDALECEVDPLRLEQVLTNLVDNSIKYSPRGGPIEVTLSQPTSSTVELSVRDHGLGISADKRDRIFERYFQAHENGYRSGMGLGLYVSRQIVELHGGHITAEFPDDGGTRVIVRLPAGAGAEVGAGAGAGESSSVPAAVAAD